MKIVFFAALTIGCSSPANPITPIADANALVEEANIVDANDGGAKFLSDDIETIDGGNVLVDHVTYLSGSLVIHGMVCRPAESGAHALVMINHGGFVGIGADATSLNACTAFASLGFVAALSSYRGEDGSDGSVEVCAGEVDDVLAMKSILIAQSYVVADRVATIGFSHGACIATMMGLRDSSLRAVVDFFGPADIGAAYTFWQTQVSNGESFCASTGQNTSTCSTLHQYLISSVKTATNGTPSDVPQAYASRSPANTLGSLTVPIMIFQGTYDYAIDISQACTKRSILKPHAWYLDTTFQVSTSTACGGAFETSPVPTTFPDPAYLFVYEGEGHGFDSAAEDNAGKIAMPFLLSRLD